MYAVPTRKTPEQIWFLKKSGTLIPHDLLTVNVAAVIFGKRHHFVFASET